MKRTSFFYFSLAAIAAGSLASCQDYDPMNENELLAIQAQKQYEAAAKEFAQNFITRFGEPDPNHTWGFGPLNASSSASQTRADGAGTVNTNRNEWADKDSQGYKSSAIASHTNIPGWPNVDGYYYADDGEQALKYISATESHRPVGDVTEFEIQYVSAWFRTHKITDPSQYRLNLHLTDFFIQNISADNDQWEYNALPSGTYTGKNGADVTTVTTDHHLSNVTLKGGTNSYLLKYNLDHLCFKPMGASVTVDDTWTHVNNYNASQNNWHPEDNPFNNDKRTIMYIHSSGTEDFACHSSEGTAADDYFYDWVLVRLTWMEQMADGEYHQREGYYLAFDCQFDKSEVKVDGDDYYSNWIVKITPASFNPEGPSKRIMCEDLGNTFDFDFNDVVFDVRYEGYPSSYTAIVSIKAAGGTLPIYVGYDPTVKTAGEDKADDYEAHDMLGDYSNPKQPINAKDGGLVRGESIYRITGLTTSDPDDIPIYVKYANGTVKNVAKANRGNIDSYPSNDSSRPYNPDQKPFGDYTVPQKFAVPITTSWKKELKFIEDSYPNFINWVKQESGNEEWYNTIQKKDELYAWNLVPENGQPTGSSIWNGNFNGKAIKLTPQKATDMSALFTDAKGGLQIAGYSGDDPIYQDLVNSQASKMVITIVYDNASAPFSGRLVPMNDTTNDNTSDFVASSSNTFAAVSVTKQMKPGRYTHSFEFTLGDVKDASGNFCDYLVLFLSTSDVTISEWHCSYK